MILKLWYAKKAGQRGHVWTLPTSSPSTELPGGVDFEDEIGEFDLVEVSALVFQGHQGIINSVSANGWHISNPNFMSRSQIAGAIQNGAYTHRLDQQLPPTGKLTPAQNAETGEDFIILVGTTISNTQAVFRPMDDDFQVIPATEYQDIIW